MKLASLSSRITALLVFTTLLILGGGAKLMDWRVDHELEGRFRQNLLTQANALSTMIQLEQDEALDEPPSQHHPDVLGADTPTYYELRCDGMPPLRSTPPPPSTPAGWPGRVAGKPRFSRLQHGHQQLGAVQYAFVFNPTGAGGPAGQPHASGQPPRHCLLLFEQDRTGTNEILLAIDWILLLSPALALIIALVAVPLVVRRGLRPITALVDRMHTIGPHAPGQRLAISGIHELDPLVARFNDVLERMDDGLARERQFASGLAHETRTRLAELRALAEVEARYPSGRSLADILGEIGQIGAELEATVTALLLLTRLQSGLEQAHPQWLPLDSWLERQLQRQQALAGSRGLTLRSQGAPPAGLHTDPALLEVVVGNLLGNACAYAPSGDTVNILLRGDGLDIDNAAPELDATDLPHFGRRFWRKQLPHAGHAGLGLALAGAAAEALGLRLEFRLDEGHRLHAMLAWPNETSPRTPPR